MRNTLGRQRASFCQFCEHLASSPKPLRRSALAVPSFQRRHPPHTRVATRPASVKAHNKPFRAPPKQTSTAPEAVHKTAADAELEFAQDKGQAILTSDSIPTEDAVLDALHSYEILARRLIGGSEAAAPIPGDERTPASALLSLDEKSTKPPSPSSSPPAQPRPQTGQKAIDALSDLAARVIRHPNVFITPKILASYIDVQSLLQRPEIFAEVFELYATKPVPQPNTSPVRYTTPNPRKVQSAIPTAIANAALTSAINTKNLPLAVQIIESSFCTPAYRRSKFMRKALLPLTGFALTPVAAYTVASQLSHYQDTMDPAMATNLAFVGILSYVVFTATIGVVAVTTANDQMNRVTWTTGLPLRERWMREEERAAIDKVASAWGFKEVERRGEEEGEEWEALREWIGLRGMVLDRVELMDGME
ncbi:MAG: hypothetical protein M1836_003268 [Candelina mexicana]|nr:MAG: hypothetical protein M1836_003268 [Candelina mexicana]